MRATSCKNTITTMTTRAMASSKRMNDRNDAQAHELSGIVVDDILDPVGHVAFRSAITL